MAPPPQSSIPRWLGAVMGVTAAAVALAIGELVCALADSTTSLVTAIGGEFVDRFAASLKEVAVEIFGTNDKAALIVGIVVIALALGAVLGMAAARGRLVVAAVGFVAFGALGWWAYETDPQGKAGVGPLAAALAAAAGVGTLVGLRWLADRTVPAAGSGGAATSRRTVLGVAGGGLAFAGLATIGSRRLGGSNVVQNAREATQLPTPVTSPATTPPTSPATTPPTSPVTTPASSPVTTPETSPVTTPDTDPVTTPETSPVTTAPSPSLDVRGLSPYVTPNGDFYRIDTALRTPQVDVADWSLSITGRVDRPYELSFDELVAMATFEETVTLSCVSNEIGGGLVGNAVWQGVPLKTLLDRARVQDGATQVVGRSVDDFTAGFPTEVGLDGRVAMVAVAMNGEPLPADHGFPARLVVAGLYGYVSATKWLREIELTTWEDFDGYWIPRGWSKEGPIKTSSRIDVPRSSASLRAGTVAVAGVAWAPPRGIAAVEVRVDDGEWVEAVLGDADSDNTWVQWVYEWEATEGDHELTVRAIDGDGETQTEERAAPAPNGASGWHRRSVTVR